MVTDYECVPGLQRKYSVFDTGVQQTYNRIAYLSKSIEPIVYCKITGRLCRSMSFKVQLMEILRSNTDPFLMRVT